LKAVYCTFSKKEASLSLFVIYTNPYPSSPKHLYLLIKEDPLSLKSYEVTPSSIYSALLAKNFFKS
jgi:hypothetical protein